MNRAILLIAPALVFVAEIAHCQGTIIFANTPSTPVSWARYDRLVQTGEYVAGLYYTTDLTAQPDTDVPIDDFQLATVVPISSNPLFPGVYVGGLVAIPGVPGGTEVRIQVRAWWAAYESYSEAWMLGRPPEDLGASNVGIVTLGGDTQPTPSTSSFVQGFAVTAVVPEPSTLLLGLVGALGLGLHRPFRRR